MGRPEGEFLMLSKNFKLITLLMLATGVCAAQPWQTQTSGVTAGLRGIHAVDVHVAWASGTGGTVLRTQDGGFHWYRCTTPPAADQLDFRAVWAWDARTALAMSSGPGALSRLFRTTDGCRTWKLIFTNPDAVDAKYPGFWDGLIFPATQYGIIYGDPVAGPTRNQSGDRELALPLLVSHDGGLTWKPGQDPSAHGG
jgi:photosystem II stability/assembly factor-like uncharacterized protein